jgi:phosphate starvation-inducible PhoH-like protein
LAAAPVKLTFDDHVPLQLVLGSVGEHTAADDIARSTGVALHLRGNEVILTGEAGEVALVERLLRQMYALAKGGTPLSPADLSRGLEVLRRNPGADLRGVFEDVILTKSGSRKPIAPRSLAQKRYVDGLRRHDLTFGVGPAGTGKTYLAVAMAIRHLLDKRVRRIILARPAIEAGESLGFLPGTMEEKVSPYMRPLYDALHDMLDPDKVARMMEHGVIEIAPLAYMRGRTLSETFVILDEAQNTTVEQMKMFLTRIGMGTKAAVTGDPSQVDLPNGQRSGLAHAVKILGGVEGVSIATFSSADVMRHALVQRIILAYDRDQQRRGRGRREPARRRGGAPSSGPGGPGGASGGGPNGADESGPNGANGSAADDSGVH